MSTPVGRTESPVSIFPTVPPQIAVWDPIVRAFHWTVALGVLLNYLVLEGGKKPHRYFGYAIAAALAIRLVWGFVGSRHARFADFIVSPRASMSHLAAVLKHRDRRYVGHNPAGAMMVIVLMLLLGMACLTGWLQGLDAFWGVEWVQTVHAFCANFVMAAAALHIIGALAESVLHRENLILSMVTGRKRPASGTDIDHAGSSCGG